MNIKEAATALSTCINLLLPHPDDFFIVDDDDTSALEPASVVSTQQQLAAGLDSDESDEGLQDAGLREVGMVSLTHSIQLQLMPSECTPAYLAVTWGQRVLEITK